MVVFTVLVINYFTSIFGISDNLQLYILNYTDKFDYLKASDLLIFYLFFLGTLGSHLSANF